MKPFFFTIALVAIGGAIVWMRIEKPKAGEKLYDPPGAVPMVQFVERAFEVRGSLWFCTNDNHRFAIALTQNGHLSICEVTDASLIKQPYVRTAEEEVSHEMWMGPELFFSNHVPYVIERHYTTNLYNP